MSRNFSFLALTVAVLFGSFFSAADQSFAQSERATYVPVPLKTDLSHLSENQLKMIPLLISAAEDMDQVFWMQAYGDRDKLMAMVDNEDDKRFAEINYGPWDRLNSDQPFVEGIPTKPAGANLYPHDLTKEEFETHLEKNAADEAAFKSLYTRIERDESGNLIAVPYSDAYAERFVSAAEKLRAASELAEDAGFKAYLSARADALLSNEYRESDMLWMDMKTNPIDCVIGPIENYEDKLNGYKAACECYVLVKDMSWSERLSKYAEMLPRLQEELPVADEYKSEKPGTDSDLNAYDVIYYAGDCNAGSKTIAINLPNDEEVQKTKGSRRLQLKNAMQAKFEKILVPISELLIVEDQRKHITFDAFFSNTMFHEVAHGLGIKETITGNGTVRSALLETASALEEGKADILGLFMITQLHARGEIGDAPLEDYYVTFMAGIFRSVRFGATSAHGKANMIRFNFFKEMDAFTREESGQYRVNMDQMKVAMVDLSNRIIMLQGNGDYEAARRFSEETGFVGPGLTADLERVNRAGIPTDVVFEQGIGVLGLER